MQIKSVDESYTIMSQITADTYMYQPLNPLKRQVRILRLAPGIFGRPLRGCLITISLDKLRRRRWQQLREWHALSYVWGASDRDEVIRITRRKVYITKTLHCALQYLRWQRDGLYLWIDQICINQDDTEERSSQVQFMREIYSCATSVFAWLGNDKPDNDGLLRMVSRMADVITFSNMMLIAQMDLMGMLKAKLEQLQLNMPLGERTQLLRDIDSCNVDGMLKPILKPISEQLFSDMSPEERTLCQRELDLESQQAMESVSEDPIFQAMRLKTSDETSEQVYRTLGETFTEFLRNAWFSRVWTLQEAVLARHLVLISGWSRATFEDFQGAYFRYYMNEEVDEFYLEHDQFEFVAMYSLRSWHQQVQDWSRRETSAAEKSRVPRTFTRIPIKRRKASDTRDYVYGQLGLSNVMVMDRLKPDYSLSIEEVFMTGTVAFLEADENLNTLGSCCAFRKDGSYSLPSWCPDWSDGNFGCGMRHVLGRLDDNIFIAATDYRSQIKYDSLGSTLCIRGLIIDEIQKCVSGSQIQTRLAHKKSNLSEIWQSVLAVFSPPDAPPFDGHLAPALCRALLADLVEGQRLDEAKTSEALIYLQDPRIGVDEHGIMDQGGQLSKYNIGSATKKYLRTSVCQFFQDRCLFETKERRYGQSCSHIRPGDKICLLYGGRLPFMLREAGLTDAVDRNDETAQRQLYQMIGGECYVNGLVDGEGLEIARRKNLPVEDFCLI